MNGSVAGTEIIVSGRPWKVAGETVTYETIVEIWNKLHEQEGVHIVGTPGIDFTGGNKKEEGLLEPGMTLEIKDGTTFAVDPEHVS